MYKQPPLMRLFLSHAAASMLLAAILRLGESLQVLHTAIQPLFNWIPNIGRLAARSVDPIFAETFIGLSLLLALLVAVVGAFLMRGCSTKVFERPLKRAVALVYIWLIFAAAVAIVWFLPYGNPASKGRAYFILEFATSTYAGIAIGLNQLLVGVPLVVLLTLQSAHLCTSSRRPAHNNHTSGDQT